MEFAAGATRSPPSRTRGGADPGHISASAADEPTSVGFPWFQPGDSSPAFRAPPHAPALGSGRRWPLADTQPAVLNRVIRRSKFAPSLRITRSAIRSWRAGLIGGCREDQQLSTVLLLPAPRSPFPAPRSPLPAPRSPFPVPRSLPFRTASARRRGRRCGAGRRGGRGRRARPGWPRTRRRSGAGGGCRRGGRSARRGSWRARG